MPIVNDMSANFMSTHIDISKYGSILVAGQKNIGATGLTINIVDKQYLN
jgi:phosphoserine aminotransferase